MAAQNGRAFLVQMTISAVVTTIAGAQSGNIAINNEPIDVTTKDSAGKRELLASGKIGADITLSGLTLDDSTIAAVRTAALAQTVQVFTVVIPGTTGGSAGSYSFSGVITALEEGGEEGGAVTYNLTVQSTGTITFTDLT